MALTDRIKEIRFSKNYTQKQLADLIGVSVSTVSAYEKGIRKPNIEILAKIVAALDVTLEYLCQDVIATGRCISLQLSDKEMKFIEKYRTLNDSEKETVERILTR